MGHRRRIMRRDSRRRLRGEEREEHRTHGDADAIDHGERQSYGLEEGEGPVAHLHHGRCTDPEALPNHAVSGKVCAAEGFSLERNSGKKPVLTSPDGQVLELDIENYIPALDTTEASSSSSRDGGGIPARRFQCHRIFVFRGQGEHPFEPQLDTLPEYLYLPKLSASRSTEHPHRRKAEVDTGSLGDELGATSAKFGDLITAGHVALGSVQESSRRGNTVALIVQDRATKRIECHPNPSKSANDTMMGLIHCVDAGDKVARLYMMGAESHCSLLATYCGGTM